MEPLTRAKPQAVGRWGGEDPTISDRKTHEPDKKKKKKSREEEWRKKIWGKPEIDRNEDRGVF